MAWRVTSKIVSTQEIMEWLQGAASTQYVEGALYKMSGGLPVVLAGQTDSPFGLCQAMDPQPYNGQNSFNVNGSNPSPLRPGTALLTTTVGERIGFVPITSGLLLDCDVAPLIANAAALVNAAKGSVVTAYAGSTSDFNGGCVYLPEQDWQGVVITSVVSGGNVTLAFRPPAPRAATTGDTVSALPFGAGFKPKFDGTAFSTTLSNAVADNTGGNVVVRKVAMQYGSTRGASAVVTCQMQSSI